MSKKKYFVTKEQLEQFYLIENHTFSETCEYFSVPDWWLTATLKKFNIKKDLELVKAGRAKRCSEKLLNRTTEEKKSAQEKRRQTKLEKYGDENYTNAEKAKQTLIDRFGSLEEANAARVEKFIKTRSKKIEDNPDYWKDRQDKIRRTKLERYGDENYQNREKYESTCLERFGVRHVFCSGPLRSKMLENMYERHSGKSNLLHENVEKIRETKLTRYGDENYNNREKYKETCLERFGYEYATSNPEIKAKVRESFIRRFGDFETGRKIILEKCYLTKAKNKTFNTSKYEEQFYEFLLSIFTEDTVIRQYKDSRYPYACDFYITQLDLFIELNLFQGHGPEPFDQNNPQHLELLEKWKNKCGYIKNKNGKKIKNQYYGYIKTWTESDPKKQETAEQNNLNYITIYTPEELIKLEEFLINEINQ